MTRMPGYDETPVPVRPDVAERDRIIRSMAAAGTSRKAIAEAVGLSATRVGRILAADTGVVTPVDRKAPVIEKGDPPFARRDRVTVTEQNITPWSGSVADVKWSPRSGWWVGIFRDDDGYWVMPAAAVTSEEGAR